MNGTDLRWRVPRKRTRFPGQFATCWYCGRQFVWGGNGLKDDLMCSGARHYDCWNSITFNGPVAVKKLVAVITDELCKLEGFGAQFSELVLAAKNGQANDSTERRRQLAAEERSLQETRENLVAAIGQFGPRPMFAERIAELDQRAFVSGLGVLQRLESVRAETIELPDSVTQPRMLEQHLESLHCLPEFGDLMRQLVPEFVVYSVRLCDGGTRGREPKVKLNLGGSIADVQRVPGLQPPCGRDLTSIFSIHPNGNEFGPRPSDSLRRT